MENLSDSFCLVHEPADRFMIDSNEYIRLSNASADLFNVLLQSSEHFNRLNSVEFLTSQALERQTRRKQLSLYTEEDKLLIQQNTGHPAIEIGEVESEIEEESQSYSYTPISFHESNAQIGKVQVPSKLQIEDLYQILPYPLANLLKQQEIPLEYIRSLTYLKSPLAVKTARRLRVERYLEKRRRKTWSRKICYNCRQKVAEERLRIKGKFIKKRRALEILGIKGYMAVPELKQKLEEMLMNKSAKQIEEIIKSQD